MINPFFHKILSLAAIFIGCFFMYGCENDVEEVRELGRKKPSIEEGKNINSYLSMNGKMKARLTAPILLRYQGDSARKTEFPKSLHVDFYNDSMKVQSQLNAKYGRYLENDSKVYLRDSVVVFNVKGDTLFCDELYWDQNTQKIYTDKKVTLSRNFRHTLIVGQNGMTANQDLSDISFFKIQPNSYSFIPDSANTSATATSTAITPTIDSTKKK